MSATSESKMTMDAAERFRAEEEERYRAEVPALQVAPIPVKAEKKPKPKKRKVIASAMTPRAIARDRRLTFAERGVALAISDKMNYGQHHDGRMKISQAKLAREYGGDERAVNAAVARIEALGYYKVDRQKGRGGTWITYVEEACEIRPKGVENTPQNVGAVPTKT